MRGLPLALFLSATASFASAPAKAFDSAYSTFDYAKCRLVDHGVGYQTHACAGPYGIEIRHTGEGEAASVAFGAKGLVGDIPVDGNFYAGKTIEWRGERKGGAFAPFAAILRYDIGPSVEGPFKSQLLVYRLNGRTSSCIAATIASGGATANERAREVADNVARSFVCGKDKPRLDQ